ncbi:hypothetical protein JB92DRAFT_2825118 [Gautieria morchelliformis]|nr:hypothetical protein JB92DRAFT_2825118 [Gautieria morchelliformis]
MSAVTLAANVCLRGGRRQTTTPTYYFPPGRLLPDDTIVRVVGHIFAPPSGTILLDVFSLTAYPGDPASEQYEDAIPNDTSVAVWGVGAVLNNAEYASDSQTRTFNLAVANYVRDGTKSFVLECLYDGNSVRWSRMPTPKVNTAIYMYGTLRGVNAQGNLTIAVDNVALNIGPATIGPSTPGRGRNAPPGRDGSVRRRGRKFAAAVSKDDVDANNSQESHRSASPLLHGPSDTSFSSVVDGTSETDPTNLKTRSGKRQAILTP